MKHSNSITFSQSVDFMAGRAFTVMDMDQGTASAIKSCEAIIELQFPVKII